MNHTKLTKAEQDRRIALWVAALRSGEYKQGKNYLDSEGKHCCLGVLCRVAMRNGLPLIERSRQATTTFDGSDQIVPKAAMDWVGLQEDDGTYRADLEVWHSLAELNDGGRSFESIADLIESRPDGLFVQPEE